eukprot:m.344736 g.344736  ORF g.344736 m.344736 type:complete len:455 (-) comp20649_c0_seq2:262-1626(-)
MAQAVRVFFDISIGANNAGRVIFELYPGIAPKTVENFRALCTGERGISSESGKRLHYLGAPFHRIIKGFMIQGGDFTDGNGTGGESIYGRTFPDETFVLKHDKPYLLSMANRGKNTNSSQFFITTVPCPHLDMKHCVFGKVVDGVSVIEMLENQPVDDNDKPHGNCYISNCGELILVSKAMAAAGSKKKKKEKKSKHKKEKKSKKSKKAKKSKHSDDGSDDDSDNDTRGEAQPTDDADKGSGNEDSGNDVSRGVVLAPPPPEPMVSRSGRIVRGRGVLRYRTPSPTFGAYSGTHGYQRRREHDARDDDRGTVFGRLGGDDGRRRRDRRDDEDWRTRRDRDADMPPRRGFGDRDRVSAGRHRDLREQLTERRRQRSRTPPRQRQRSRTPPRRPRSPSPAREASQREDAKNAKESTTDTGREPDSDADESTTKRRNARTTRAESTGSSDSSSGSDD